jgi:hypothetical protein
VYVRYCSLVRWDDELLDHDPRAPESWEGAWGCLGAWAEVAPPGYGAPPSVRARGAEPGATVPYTYMW